MMEFTKNKNIVTITVAPKKAYTIDINTGTVYGIRNQPIKQIQKKHSIKNPKEKNK